MTIEDIAKTMIDGHTVMFGTARYTDDEIDKINKGQKIGASSKHWLNQQIYAIDIDNGKNSPYMSIQDVIKHLEAKQVLPAFIYTTKSHTTDHHKMRVVFVLDKPATTKEEHDKVMNYLFGLFVIEDKNTICCMADISCSDRCRLFYPGNELVYENYGSIIKLENRDNSLAIKKIINIADIAADITDETNNNNTTTMIELIKNKDYDSLRAIIFLKLKSFETRMALSIKDYRRSININNLNKLRVFMLSERQNPENALPIVLSDDYYDFFSFFPLHFLLGVDIYTNFKCILPGHNDKNPSARVELTDEGKYIYHCYKCSGANRYMDIFDLIEKITGATHLESKEFLNKLLGINIKVEWNEKKRADLTEYQEYVTIDDDCAKRFKLLHSKLVKSNTLIVLLVILSICRRYVISNMYLSMSTKEPLFVIDVNHIAKLTNNLSEKKVSRITIHNRIKYLTKLGLIVAVSDEDIPDKLKKELKLNQKRKDYKYRTNVFTIPDFKFELFQKAESIIKEMDKACFRRSAYCREMELRFNGIETANKQYVQDNNSSSNKNIEIFYVKYKSIAKRLIKKNGITSEKIILSKIKEYSTSLKCRYSCICMPQLLKELSLKRILYSKKLENELNVKKGKFRYGASKVIVKEDSNV